MAEALKSVQDSLIVVNGVDKYRCCDFNFTYNSFFNHRRNVHSEKTEFKCDRCGKIFKVKYRPTHEKSCLKRETCKKLKSDLKGLTNTYKKRAPKKTKPVKPQESTSRARKHDSVDSSSVLEAPSCPVVGSCDESLLQSEDAQPIFKSPRSSAVGTDDFNLDSRDDISVEAKECDQPEETISELKSRIFELESKHKEDETNQFKLAEQVQILIETSTSLQADLKNKSQRLNEETDRVEHFKAMLEQAQQQCTHELKERLFVEVTLSKLSKDFEDTRELLKSANDDTIIFKGELEGTRCLLTEETNKSSRLKGQLDRTNELLRQDHAQILDIQEKNDRTSVMLTQQKSKSTSLGCELDDVRGLLLEETRKCSRLERTLETKQTLLMKAESDIKRSNDDLANTNQVLNDERMKSANFDISLQQQQIHYAKAEARTNSLIAELEETKGLLSEKDKLLMQEKTSSSTFKVHLGKAMKLLNESNEENKKLETDLSATRRLLSQALKTSAELQSKIQLEQEIKKAFADILSPSEPKQNTKPNAKVDCRDEAGSNTDRTVLNTHPSPTLRRRSSETATTRTQPPLSIPSGSGSYRNKTNQRDPCSSSRSQFQSPSSNPSLSARTTTPVHKSDCKEMILDCNPVPGRAFKDNIYPPYVGLHIDGPNLMRAYHPYIPQEKNEKGHLILKTELLREIIKGIPPALDYRVYCKDIYIKYAAYSDNFEYLEQLNNAGKLVVVNESDLDDTALLEGAIQSFGWVVSRDKFRDYNYSKFVEKYLNERQMNFEFTTHGLRFLRHGKTYIPEVLKDFKFCIEDLNTWKADHQSMERDYLKLTNKILVKQGKPKNLSAYHVEKSRSISPPLCELP